MSATGTAASRSTAPDDSMCICTRATSAPRPPRSPWPRGAERREHLVAAILHPLAAARTGLGERRRDAEVSRPSGALGLGGGRRGRRRLERLADGDALGGRGCLVGRGDTAAAAAAASIAAEASAAASAQGAGRRRRRQTSLPPERGPWGRPPEGAAADAEVVVISHEALVAGPDERERCCCRRESRTDLARAVSYGCHSDGPDAGRGARGAPMNVATRGERRASKEALSSSSVATLQTPCSLST